MSGDGGQQPTGHRPNFYFEIFAVALAAILLEIAYTRIFSFKVFYYFTYLIIGLGLLGIGAGGVMVAVSARLRAIPPERLIALLCLIGGVGATLGYYVVALTPLNASTLTSDPAEVARLVSVCVVLLVPFLSVGIAISTILGARPEETGWLYGTDLCGAALGCAVVIPLLTAFDPPGTIALSGLILALGAVRLARDGALRIATIAICVGLAIPVVLAKSLLPDPVVDRGKHYEEWRDKTVFTQWHPVFRVDLTPASDQLYLLHHDGQPGSGLRKFDGSFDEFAYLDTDPRSIPFSVLPEDPKVLIIGAAGGHEIVASTYFGAEHITGVELNPVTVSLITEHFADESGRLAERENVDLINGDGRWFLKQTDEQYDLIWFVAPDSYAAMNASTAGAFVLSESYLYTVEMLREAFAHLSPNGMICAQFGELDFEGKPNRTVRYLATARQALLEEGVTNFADHAILAKTAGFAPLSESVILLTRSPLDPAQIRNLEAQTRRVDAGEVRWAPGRRSDGSAPNQIITMEEARLEPWFDTYPYEVDPVYDDSPFFWHFSRFRDALAADLELEGGPIDYEDTIGEKVTIYFLVLAIALASVFLILPFLTIRDVFRELPHKGSTAAYFCALGLGFMFIEVALIQKLTLFLGYPTHSLSVTLFGVLVFSGIGSLMSERFVGQRDRTLAVLLAALVALVLVYQFALPAIIDAFVGSPVALRVAITVALIAPLGLCLGSFMPIGLRTVAGHAGSYTREYIAWAWAINGFFSVIASVLSTILGMIVGFKLLMVISLVVYAIGIAALWRVPEGEVQAQGSAL